MGRKAASVFPVPVGAMSKTFLPDRIIGIVLVCGIVGSANPLLLKSL